MSNPAGPPTRPLGVPQGASQLAQRPRVSPPQQSDSTTTTKSGRPLKAVKDDKPKPPKAKDKPKPSTPDGVPSTDLVPVTSKQTKPRKEPKEPNPARTVQTGQLVPTDPGLAMVLLFLWSHHLYGRNHLPPAPGRKEFAQRRNNQAYIDSRVLLLRELAANSVRIIAVMNSKGGSGKSPLAANLATVLMWAIDMQVLLADVNENDGTGHQALGILRKLTRSVRYVMNNLEDFQTYRQLCRQLSTPRQQHKGVMLIASDPGVTGEFNGELFVQMLLTIWMSVHTIVIDGGNGNENTPNERSVATATDLLIPTMAGDARTFDKAITTLAAHYNMGHADKVQTAFIVVNATQPGDTREKYLDMLQAAAEELTAEDVSPGKSDSPLTFSLQDLGIDINSIFLIPYDQYIKDRGIADVLSLQEETLIAVLELLIAIFSRPNPEPATPQPPAPTSQAS